jgi:site-specific DNA recombinase
MTRVAAYCRVSTDKSDQVNSFESQKLFFQDYIVRRDGWVLSGIYADEGITGTTTADRSGFCRMIDDAVSGKFQLIITKEVSRFSRNILDAIKFTRDLKELGVGVIFLNDGISTLEPDAELRLGIMASVAQEESRKTSERVKWGQQRRMERGVVFGRSLLGYNVLDGKITVEPVGAEIVQRIYRLFLDERLGTRAIAVKLTSDGVRTHSGGLVWNPATVRKILRNEKYCGDLVQRKTVTTNYLTHQKKQNKGEAELIIIREHHEAIISRQDWDRVQSELKRRSPQKSGQSHGSKYMLSGKIICGNCKRPYVCRTRKNSGGDSYRTWRCGGNGCGMAGKQVREEVLCTMLREICSLLDVSAADLAAEMTDVMKAALNGCDHEKLDRMIRLTEQKKLRLTDTYLSGELSREEYRELRQRYEHELFQLKVKAQSTVSAECITPDKLIDAIKSLLSGQDMDDDFYMGLAERFEVFSDGTVAIKLYKMSGECLFALTGPNQNS